MVDAKKYPILAKVLASSQKFYKAEIEVTVLANSPIDFENLADLNHKITEGDWMGNYSIKSHDEIKEEDAAEVAIKLGGDPEFLGIDESLLRPDHR